MNTKLSFLIGVIFGGIAGAAIGFGVKFIEAVDHGLAAHDTGSVLSDLSDESNVQRVLLFDQLRGKTPEDITALLNKLGLEYFEKQLDNGESGIHVHLANATGGVFLKFKNGTLVDIENYCHRVAADPSTCQIKTEN